jgi:hemerythrin-like domain-containing protein
MKITDSSRRDFLAAARGTGAGLLLAALAEAAPEKKAKKKPEPEEEEVAPAEDLMREHGVLNRILLIYEEGLRRLDARQDLSPEILSGAAGIIRRFIEEYHEKLEEENLFPRFEKAGKLVDLVAVLREQHQAGRHLTGEIQRLAKAGAIVKEEDRRRLSDSMRLFIRMYRPHEAREDTVLFPAFRSIVSKKEYEALGEAFEEQEHRLFGSDGFEKIVAEVAGLEKPLGIYELSGFTPK